MATITVIIPVYNSEKYLKRCLDSLIQQDIRLPYKVYIVDDGSEDQSAQIAKEYCIKNPDLFTYFYKKNGGQGSARNYGLEYCSSEYVVFVDSDDYVEKSFLSTLYELCEVNNAEISMCGVNRVMSEDGFGKRFDSGFSKDFVTEDIDSLLLTCSFAPWNKMFSRKVIGSLRFPEGMTYEDFAIIPQIINRATKVAYNHTILYHYFFNPNSTIVSANRLKKTDRNIIFAQHILEESELNRKPFILENFYLRRVLSSMAWSLLEYHEDENEVLALVEEALKKYPNIKNNTIIKQEPIQKRIFLILILHKRILIGKVWVNAFSCIRKIKNKFFMNKT